MDVRQQRGQGLHTLGSDKKHKRQAIKLAIAKTPMVQRAVAGSTKWANGAQKAKRERLDKCGDGGKNDKQKTV